MCLSIWSGVHAKPGTGAGLSTPTCMACQLSDVPRKAGSHGIDLKKPMQKADQKREDVGVELYGYQQQLAKLQLGFEKAQEQCLVISKVRRKLEEQLEQLKRAASSETDFTQKERQKARWLFLPIFCS